MEETTTTTAVPTPGELEAVTRTMRAAGVAHFTYKGCEVTFFSPEAMPFNEGQTEDEQKAMQRRRRELADLDTYGSA